MRISTLNRVIDFLTQPYLFVLLAHGVWFIIAVMLGVWFKQFWKKERKSKTKFVQIIIIATVGWLIIDFLFHSSLPDKISSSLLLFSFFSPLSFLIGFALGVLIEQHIFKYQNK